MKQLNKLIKQAMLNMANAGNAKDSVLYSQALTNLLQAKQTMVFIKHNQ